jgi:hypothetical protein
MQPSPIHEAAEAHFRRMVESFDLTPPDDVDYTDDSVIFLWHEPKLAVVVELGDPAIPA